jgi:non-ribosomal peptide synthetase component F
LYKCSQSDCINVLSPSANRTRPETKGLIGDFAHQVLFHVNFAGDPEFRELLQQVKRVVLDANTHQDLPFRDLMARLFPDQVAKVGKTSFMQQLTGICFSYDKAEEDELRLYNLNVQPIVSEEVTAILDLTFSVTEDQKGLHLTAIYRDDLFHASTIDRMLEQYETILRKIVSNPKASLSVLLTG